MLLLVTIMGLTLGLGISALVAHWPAANKPAAEIPQWLLPGLAAVALACLSLAIEDPRQLIVAAVGAAVLLLLAALDLTYRVLPNAIVFPATLAALLLGPAPSALSAAAGALAGLTFFGGLAWLGQRLYRSPALGMGDVKLAMFLGALLGATAVWAALLLGMVVAGLVAAVWLLSGRATGRATMPYGTVMALAGLVVLVVTSAG